MYYSLTKRKKNVKKVTSLGSQGIVAGTGAGTGRQILFPKDSWWIKMTRDLGEQVLELPHGIPNPEHLRAQE